MWTHIVHDQYAKMYFVHWYILKFSSVGLVVLGWWFLAAGMISISVPVQLNIWWVTHMVVLFWTFRYPVLAQTARARRGLQVVHITSLVLGLLYPILPIITTILDDVLRQSGNIAIGKLGFTFSAFPPNLCTGRNPHIVFYLVIFPSVLLMQLGTTCLVLLIWTIHKVSWWEWWMMPTF